jgi:hypothetical protein
MNGAAKLGFTKIKKAIKLNLRGEKLLIWELENFVQCEDYTFLFSWF